MRICMLAYAFYDSDPRIRLYAETLRERGDEVDIISLRSEEQLFFSQSNGIRIYRIQKRTRNEQSKLSYLIKLILFFIKSSLFITSLFFKRNYSVIHVHSIPDFEVFAAAIPKILGAKVILDIHDIVPEFYASKFGVSHSSLIFKILVYIEKLSTSFADHVIIANDLWHEKITNRSVRKDKCTAILNYPNPSLFYKRHISRRNGKFIIIFPGTLNRHQGVDLILSALAVIKECLMKTEFHIYGDGPEKENLIRLSKELELEDVVKFNKILPIDEIPQKILNADLGIVAKRKNSFGNEAFSTKIHEFMSLGVPVIVADTKIDKYYFNEKIVKFFAADNIEDLANCILNLKNDKNMRQKLSENALRYISKNNWTKKRIDYLNIIDTLS